MTRQGVRLEPLLQAISEFLDEQQQIVEKVRRDLAHGLKKPKSGRRGLTPQQVLRSFVLKRVKNWDYRELRERIADGMTLRQFTEFHWQRVPKHHAYQTNYVEEGEHFDHLWRFADKDDGYLDEIHPLREKYDADVAVLMVDDPTGCGLATRVFADADEAFAVVHHACALTSYSVAHDAVLP